MGSSILSVAHSVEKAVSQHLTEGSDDRLHLNKAGLNKYHVAPHVEDSTTIQRAFCTCSPPSQEGFDACCKLLPTLQDTPEHCQAVMDGVRQRLKEGLGFSNDDVELVFHPSGTDAEYLPLLYATQRADALGCPRVVNVIAAGGEVGSHTATAAAGNHISHIRPLGGSCVLNEPVEGFHTDKIKVIEVMPRCSVGGIVPNYDVQMEEALEGAEAEVSGAFYVLHAALSKTGLLMPSHGTVDKMLQKFEGRVLLVFDACQLRVSREEMQWYLDRGAMILVTGSKFYGGPGFCGAVVCPKQVVEEFRTNTIIPEGLSSYLTKTDVPVIMTALHNSLTEKKLNVGLLLRWLCALTELEAFNEHRELLTSKMSTWVTGVREAVSSYAPNLELLGDEGQQAEGHMGGWNTTIAIKMHVEGTGELSLNDLKRVHVLLRKDLSKMLPPNATQQEKQAVKKKCFIGQPVWLGCCGIMRIALGAPNTRKWLEEGGVEAALQEDHYILGKWSLISKYYKELTC